MEISFPHTGIQAWKNPHGIAIFRLHYSADPDKTPEWAAKQKAAMTNPADYEQEYEINFSAKLGTLIYQMHDEATLEPLAALPATGTEYMALDPHPRVRHAMLWLRVDHWGDAWAYREVWPSAVCGLPGNVPEDERQFAIKDYVETAKWLESSENPQNGGKDQDIYQRVIDYSARAMGKGLSDENPELNIQDRYEELSGWHFDDSIKDHDAGYEAVNDWLKPRDVEQSDGIFKPKSKLHIIAERCPELVHELKTNRYQQLTPLLADRQDPSGKPVAKRNHMTDCLRYLCMAGLEYVPKRKLKSNWRPIAAGINY